MVEKVRLVPETADSHPFARAAVKCDFAGNGYVEEEFFVYGKANLYDADENEKAHVIASDVPYVNRMLVRRPKDARRFSGNVVIELLNPTAHMISTASGSIPGSILSGTGISLSGLSASRTSLTPSIPSIKSGTPRSTGRIRCPTGSRRKIRCSPSTPSGRTGFCGIL